MKETWVPMVSISPDEFYIFTMTREAEADEDVEGERNSSSSVAWPLGVAWGWRNDLLSRVSVFFKEEYCEQKHISNLDELWALSGGNQWRLNCTL